MKVSVFIGRFQPPTIAHQEIIYEALKRSDRLIIVVGSAYAPISLRNPFMIGERLEMLMPIISKVNKQTDIIIIKDSVYDFNDWFHRLQKKIDDLVNEDDELEYIGHKKDFTSFYLDYFDNFYEIGELENNLSSTDIRNAWYNDELETVKDKIPPNVYSFLKNYDISKFNYFKNEYEFIKKYKEPWKNCPYPPTFVTTDAVVYRKGKVLLIKRGRNPGKGKYALPGGFLDQKEIIKESCIRELKEETKINVSKKILYKSITKEHIFDDPNRDPRGRVLTHAFLLDISNLKEEPKIKAADDADEVMWIPVSKLDKLEPDFFNDHLQIIRYFIKY